MAGYTGIGGTARKLKRVYVGVNGVARKIKRMYVGVNGIARLWYKAKGTLAYQGTATALSAARANLSSANTTNHVVFAGGASAASSGTASKVVNAYDKALTITTAGTGLAKAREHLAAASLDGKAIFAGGSAYSDTTSYLGNVDITDTSAIDSEMETLLEEITLVTELTRKCVNENTEAAQNQEDYAARYNGYVERYEKAKNRYTELAEQREAKEMKGRAVDRFADGIAGQKEPLTEFDDFLWLTAVERVTVRNDGVLVFRFYSGCEYEG